MNTFCRMCSLRELISSLVSELMKSQFFLPKALPTNEGAKRSHALLLSTEGALYNEWAWIIMLSIFLYLHTHISRYTLYHMWEINSIPCSSASGLIAHWFPEGNGSKIATVCNKIRCTSQIQLSQVPRPKWPVRYPRIWVSQKHCHFHRKSRVFLPQ